MDDRQLLRYARHLMLDEIGVEGQQRLLRSHALVIGAGGLGSPVALYLGTAGVGRMTVVDHDDVDGLAAAREVIGDDDPRARRNEHPRRRRAHAARRARYDSDLAVPPPP